MDLSDALNPRSKLEADAGVPPPAGHCHSTGQLLQQQTDTPSVCEGEVSQVLPAAVRLYNQHCSM